jgi:hypothetical protein
MVWQEGAAIDWHHDANQPYLAQRSHSAVAYLNTPAPSDEGGSAGGSAGAASATTKQLLTSFAGGCFSFQDGPEPRLVRPAAGRLVAYTAGRGLPRSACAVPAATRRAGWGTRCHLVMHAPPLPPAADARNVHRVEPVAWGQRITLAMWFTLDEAFQEDVKVDAGLAGHGLAAGHARGSACQRRTPPARTLRPP